jgi:hypothetical protein
MMLCKKAIYFDNVKFPRNDARQREAFGVRELAPAFARVEPSKSAGKPDALQRLRPASSPNRIPSRRGNRRFTFPQIQFPGNGVID